ncbi:MAG: CopG family ribbon-helix-helix protein [Thermoplasmatota archaeon]
MAVVSMSLPDDLVAEMDGAIDAGDYKGRSEFLRAAVRRQLQAETDASGAAAGDAHVHGSITTVYGHGHEARVSDVRHAYHDVVLSLMHTHCEPEVCMDVLIVGGAADRVHGLQAALERLREVDRATLVPTTSFKR